MVSVESIHNKEIVRDRISKYKYTLHTISPKPSLYQGYQQTYDVLKKNCINNRTQVQKNTRVVRNSALWWEYSETVGALRKTRHYGGRASNFVRPFNTQTFKHVAKMWVRCSQQRVARAATVFLLCRLLCWFELIEFGVINILLYACIQIPCICITQFVCIYIFVFIYTPYSQSTLQTAQTVLARSASNEPTMVLPTTKVS